MRWRQQDGEAAWTRRNTPRACWARIAGGQVGGRASFGGLSWRVEENSSKQIIMRGRCNKTRDEQNLLEILSVNRTKEAETFYSYNHYKWIPYQIQGGKTVKNVQNVHKTT